jgi:hypothetical protein
MGILASSSRNRQRAPLIRILTKTVDIIREVDI